MRTAKQSVYAIIVDDVKKKIKLGLLKEGEKLPSCRELALKTGVNPNTVQRAYTELEESGYIYTLPKKGVYVSATDKTAYRNETAKEKLCELKNAGITRKELEMLIEEIYGGNYDKS